ncbi:MAG: mechanosensitive ion channel domain-containing protein [Leptolyngbyaceae bacterium]|nr:mechanosensitive ion channel domain-containing protein [Leptolyngbyaceae bacterium]
MRYPIWPQQGLHQYRNGLNWGRLNLGRLNLNHRFRQRRWPLIIGFVAALLLITTPAMAQLSPLVPGGEAAVVVDGRVIFKIKDAATLTATERATHINRELLREVREVEAVGIAVKSDRQRNLIYLQSQTSQDILLTVTEADVVVPGGELEQAEAWAKDLEAALRQGQQERKPRYLQQASVYSGIALVGAIAIHLIFQLATWLGYRRLNRWFEYASNPFTQWEKPTKIFWHLGTTGFLAALWLSVIYYITDLFPQARIWRYGIINILTADIIQLGDGRYSALALLLLILATVGVWFGVNSIIYFLRVHVFSRAQLERRVQDIVSVLLKYVLIFLGVLILLQLWGIDASSLAIIASVLGVGIGFGIQNITNNFISGFIITLERPIQVGDFVNVGELMGTVEKIGARSTEIITLDQVTIIIPNSRFLENEVINWSHGSAVSRLHLPIGVAYGSDITEVKKALLEAIRRHPEVLMRPKPEVFFQSFGENSLNFEVMVWTGDPRKQFKVKSDLNYEIEASLRRHNISIPFPQRDLHVRSPQLDTLVEVLQQTVHSHFPHLAQTAAVAAANMTPLEFSADTNSTPSKMADQGDETTHLNVSADLDLEALAREMQGSEGLDIGDRTYNGQTYAACFTGTNLVEWLVQTRDYSRDDAILIGQWLLQQGLIHPTTDHNGFEDGYHFYQFYRDPA